MKFALAAAVTTFLLLTTSISFSDTAGIGPEFEAQIGMLNELSERRRVNTFFVNEQSISNGVQKGFVNVGTGNLTFIRHDLVTVGRATRGVCTSVR